MIEWPLSPRGEPFPIGSTVNPAVVFKDGSHAEIAKKFVRFLVADGWLAHYLNFSLSACSRRCRRSSPSRSGSTPAIRTAWPR